MGKACIYFKKISDINLNTLMKLSLAKVKFVNKKYECACTEK
jgi:hypothetical protein